MPGTSLKVLAFDVKQLTQILHKCPGAKVNCWGRFFNGYFPPWTTGPGSGEGIFAMTTCYTQCVCQHAMYHAQQMYRRVLHSSASPEMLRVCACTLCVSLLTMRWVLWVLMYSLMYSSLKTWCSSTFLVLQRIPSLLPAGGMLFGVSGLLLWLFYPHCYLIVH